LRPEAKTKDSAVLSVRQLETAFENRGTIVRAVRGVSFDLAPGERLGVVGESGCGKSAMALSILRLIEPPGRITGGQVWLNGRELMGASERTMRKVRGREVALIYQDPMNALNPVRTIGSQLVEAIRQHERGISRRAARRRAESSLRDVGLSNATRRFDDYPHQYSGGMRQRVVIAIALANQPDVLIADEPTTALDVTTQAQILTLLSDLASEMGSAVILITHNLGVVAEFCDRVRVMYAGRIVEAGTTRGLFRQQIHPYTEGLLRSVPQVGQLERTPLLAIPGAPPDLAQLPAGCSFEPRCPVGAGKAVCRDHFPNNYPVSTADDPTAEAECHFAPERAGLTAGVALT
jgi:oligopeptide/dipeptide ABC transporter ATP-binding protein